MKGVKVIHKLLGEGSVVSLNNDMLTVQFPEKELSERVESLLDKIKQTMKEEDVSNGLEKIPKSH